MPKLAAGLRTALPGSADVQAGALPTASKKSPMMATRSSRLLLHHCRRPKPAPAACPSLQQAAAADEHEPSELPLLLQAC